MTVLIRKENTLSKGAFTQRTSLKNLILCIVPVIYYVFQSTGWINLTITSIVLFSLVLVISIANNKIVYNTFLSNRFSLAFLLFCIICALSVLFTSDLTLSLQYLLILFIGFFIFLNLANDLSWVGFFFKVCFVMSLISIFSTFISYYNYGLFKTMFYPIMNNASRSFSENYVTLFNQHSGIWGQTGSNGFMIIMGIPYLLSNIARKKKVVFNILILLLLLIAILFTGKRGYFLWGLISLVVALSFSKNSSNPFRPFLVFVGLLIPIIVLIIILYNSSPLVSSFIDGFFSSDSGDISSGRFYLYEESIQIFKNNPLFGVGIGSYKVVSPSQNHVHNDYLELFAETGFFGGLLFIIIMVFSLVKVIGNFKNCNVEKCKYYTGVSFVIYYFFFSMITSIIFHEYGNLFYLITIFAAIYSNVLKKGNLT